MTDLEQLWIDFMVKMGRTVVILERSGGAAIYKSWVPYEAPNELSSRMYNMDVYFHVWDGDEHYVLKDLQEAQKLYEKRAKERR